MRLAVLGTSLVLREDGPVELGARRPRSLLAALVLRLGSDLTPDALVELVWGEDGAPRGAHATLHSYLSGVRRVLEPGLGPRQRPTVLLTGDHGYRLALDRSQVDAHLFADEVRRLHRSLSPLTSQLGTGPATGWPDHTAVTAAVDRLEELLGLWRGQAYADLGDVPAVQAERAALDQLRLNAEEDRVLGLLALGDHAVVVAATEQAASRYPLQERVWALHALALARSGRQAESLAALRHIRAVLADELGIDPGPELQALERAVLTQDPALQQWLRPSAPAVAPGGPVEVGSSVTGSGPAPGATAPIAPVAPVARVARAGGHGWVSVGREREEAQLLELLDQAEAGVPSAGLLVGEPGVGKTHLVERLAAQARQRGFVVVAGRCSQDDGAPPLWPWSQLLRELGADDPVVGEALAGSGGIPESPESRAFRTWEQLARTVLDRAAAEPVLVVLEDLHWADAATLRALRHLLATAAPGDRVVVAATRRPWPEPTGALAQVGEELARRHAVRLDLTGLSSAQARQLVTEVRGAPVPAEVVDRWHERAGGNPFFLIELARLGDQPARAGLPATVRDVIVRRLDLVPESTRSLILLAATLGRRSPLELLAAVADQDVDEVEDALVPALEAGLVSDQEAGVVAFSHALTRDAVADAAGPSRLARMHARVAHALTDRDDVAALVAPEERVAELARHWLAAGPSHVSRAWRAAAEAASQARRSFSFEESETLMQAAVEAHRRDRLGTPEQRYQLLLQQAADRRRLAEWDQVLPLAAEAVALARAAGDLDRLAAAAAYATQGSVWLPQNWDEVLEDLVEDLRWGLSQAAAGDSVVRCRLMLALSVQLYYDAAADAEVEALVDEGMAMARRLDGSRDDPALLGWAAHTAWLALWSPRYGARRHDLAGEELAAARRSGDPDAELVALVTAAGTALELDDRDGYEAASAQAERLARSRRNSYALVALEWVRFSLAVMAADEATAQRLSARLLELRPLRNAHNAVMFGAAVQITPLLWRGDLDPFLAPLVGAWRQSEGELGRGLVVLVGARCGATDVVRELLATPVRFTGDHWSTSTETAADAEAALLVGDAATAARAVAVLAPLSGRMAVSGISMVLGPVDGYLALALAAAGQREQATEAADRAQVMAVAWGLADYTRWLDRLRADHRF